MPRSARLVRFSLLLATLLIGGALYRTAAAGAQPGNRPTATRPVVQNQSALPPLQGTPTATPGCVPGWSLVANPGFPTGARSLHGVAAVTATNLWAVGGYSPPGTPQQTLIEHGDGLRWTQVASPSVITAVNELWGITALAANDVWAVGDYYLGASQRPLVEHWDGTRWSVIPAAPGNMGELFAVTALAPNDVWAVGGSLTSTTYETLIEHWDGTQWQILPSPNLPGQPSNVLYGVTALAADNVWAVGVASTQTLVEHWDGSAWRISPSPNPSSLSVLLGVTAVAANNIWAVGEMVVNSIDQPLIEHWDGTTWSSVPNPSPAENSHLSGIVAQSATDIWAVGGNYMQYGPTLTEHWDGTQWTLVPSPSPDPETAGFAAVAVAGGTVWAVGTAGRTTFQGLIARYDSRCPTYTPTATPPATATGTPPTVTPCPVQFTDVPAGSTFYDPIRCLACRGIGGGYPCGAVGEPCPGPYFRPNADVTRGQVAKIVAAAAGFTEAIPNTQQSFEDVAPGSSFALWIERLSLRGIIGGYPCGGPFEPCLAPDNRPYFRPNNPVTRGQLSKIVASAAHYTEIPGGQTFADVAPASTFYVSIERLANRGIIGGYPCGGAGEPCDAPRHYPYFRPNNPATRGQMSKIAANAFFPNCATPARR